MAIKRVALVVLAFCVIGCSQSTVKIKTSENINFFNYAYSICIGSAFNPDEVKEDANRSANAYMEQGNISLDAYQELRDRIDIWLAKKYLGKNGEPLQIMKCNDFYNSGEVQDIYDKYDPCKSSEGWLDIDDFNMRCG
ncbi:MAG: T6SS amidase immunity protein Tai4 family protein [Pseudomonadota bacterium]|nr:T6SS amidase immunity protein Tai4 family protein [Pseudomonadota bacterium]